MTCQPQDIQKLLSLNRKLRQSLGLQPRLLHTKSINKQYETKLQLFVMSAVDFLHSKAFVAIFVRASFLFFQAPVPLKVAPRPIVPGFGVIIVAVVPAD